MNKYNHWLAKIFGYINNCEKFAVTFGQTSYYSKPENMISTWHRVHEDVHKRQYKKDGWVKFLIRYLFQLLTKGYLNIDYEKEARKEAHSYGGPPV